PTSLPPLSLHDALPIFRLLGVAAARIIEEQLRTLVVRLLNFTHLESHDDPLQKHAVEELRVRIILENAFEQIVGLAVILSIDVRSEEHTSELQSLRHLV